MSLSNSERLNGYLTFNAIFVALLSILIFSIDKETIPSLKEDETLFSQLPTILTMSDILIIFLSLTCFVCSLDDVDWGRRVYRTFAVQEMKQGVKDRLYSIDTVVDARAAKQHLKEKCYDLVRK